jgi:thiamine biosynthesis lipoprotein
MKMIRTKKIPLLAILLLGISCSEPADETKNKAQVQVIRGEAQGTTYSVKYVGDEIVTKSELDSALRAIDLSLSAWVDESTLSRFNRSDSLFISDPHFLEVFFRGKELSDLTGGAFHPMIMPLVKAWGFGPDGGKLKDNLNLDSVRALVSFDFDVRPAGEEEGVYFIKDGRYQIDVNGIAQGYSVDVLSEMMEAREVNNYMVEIGGEVRTKGSNESGEPWRIGVDKPVGSEEERTLEAIVNLDDAALATSGSYRKFYEMNGKKYSHTIDPRTGYPVDHGLLSATVKTDNCTDADALATAFMVMGLEKTKDFLSEQT